MTRALVVMGVSGAGKTTLARSLAEALGWDFVEGDECHPAANVAKMAAGVPLTNEDRLPFLENVAAAINAAPGRRAVASCSALKRAYRDLLRVRCGDVVFILPEVDAAALRQRMMRRAHFMPAALLESQLATLEPPDDDERAVVLDGSRPVKSLVAELVGRLALIGEAGSLRSRS